MTQHRTPVQRLNVLIEETRRRVEKQSLLADLALHTDGHPTAVRLCLLFSDILFELHQTRDILERTQHRLEAAPVPSRGETRAI